MDNDLVLGIDIGGTKTAFGFVDRGGTMISATSMPTQVHNSAEALVSLLHQRVEKVRAGLPSSHRLCGIGIGAPNAHHDRGTIEKAVNLNWGETVDLVGLIRKHYDLPVSITNDANAAAIGEMLFGNARGMKHFMVITLGTGLGSGIVADGRLLHGASGFAGELGHTVVDPEGRQCRCGKRGCLETYVSATGLVRTTLMLLAERCDPSPLRAMSYEEMTARRIFELAAKGDIIALEAFDRTARILGLKLADAVAHTSPEAIFLTGGMAMAGDLLLKPTQQYMDKFLFGVYKGTVKLVLSGLETGKSAVLGAAALIWSELEL
jgi:glucokinase